MTDYKRSSHIAEKSLSAEMSNSVSVSSSTSTDRGYTTSKAQNQQGRFQRSKKKWSFFVHRKLPRLHKSITRYPTVVGVRIKQSVGFRIRKVIYAIDETISPLLKKLIPNFIVAHYVYIFCLAILGSILIYPQHNISYIDALFFGTGAATQAGLNTVNVNDLTLFQQLSIYFICMISTPIFIHSMVVFIRLYWFQKSMDDIKEKSAKNFRMRRSATLAAIRTMTMDNNRSNSIVPNKTQDGSDYNTHNAQEELDTRLQKFNHSLRENRHKDIKAVSTEDIPADGEGIELKSMSSAKSATQSTSALAPYDNADDPDDVVIYNGVEHHSEPSDDEEEAEIGKESRNGESRQHDNRNMTSGKLESSPDGRSKQDEESNDDEEEDGKLPIRQVKTRSSPKKQDIQFAELPRPDKKRAGKRRNKDIDPRDLYMSISMMQHRSHQNNVDVESGPALHINGPAERERLRLPGHHHRHRKYHRQRRHQRLRLLRQQAQRDFLARDELHEMEKEDGGKNGVESDASDDDNYRDSFNNLRGTVAMWRRHWSRGLSSGSPMKEGERPLKEIKEGVPESDASENAISDGESEISGSRARDSNKDPEKLRKKGQMFVSAAKRRFSTSPTMERGGSMGMGILPKLSKRLTKTFTQRSFRTPSNVNPADMTDDELISLYSRTGALHKAHYLSWHPTVGRNSTFVALTESQRQELGGVEYRSLKLLSVILMFYYIGFHLLSLAFFLPFILKKKNYQKQVEEDGISPTWWAFFTAQTVFNDLGYTLTPDSMMAFNKNAYVLILGSFFIVIGNTGFPIFLRFIIWILYKLSRPLTMYHESLAFLLQHPRRCFTLLFPSAPTWWLFAVLVVLNATDWILFLILDFSNKSLQDIPKGYRVLDGLFQAFSTRTAGLSVVNIGSLHSAIQVSYMIMMYISVLPLAISIRRTNVYEEQSLGIYLDDDEEASQNSRSSKGPGSYISMHLRRQLSFDLWFIFLGLFIICICENSRLQSGDYNFQVFGILFEIVSAYGTVGLSMGYPNYDPSFSGQLTTLSKLVIIAMMIRGRHRGLPYSIDRAVILNTNSMKERDELQAYRTLRRSQTMASRAATRYSTQSGASSAEIESEDQNNDVPHSPWKRALVNVGELTKKAVKGMLMGPGQEVNHKRYPTETIENSFYGNGNDEEVSANDDDAEGDLDGEANGEADSGMNDSRHGGSVSLRSNRFSRGHRAGESFNLRSTPSRSRSVSSYSTSGSESEDDAASSYSGVSRSVIEPEEISDSVYNKRNSVNARHSINDSKSTRENATGSTIDRKIE